MKKHGWIIPFKKNELPPTREQVLDLILDYLLLECDLKEAVQLLNDMKSAYACDMDNAEIEKIEKLNATIESL